ncbi:MAG: DUF58 domain-containing protein [Steroidobacteraceae bacterium]
MSLPTLEELLALRGAAHNLSLQHQRRSRATVLGAHTSAQRGRGLEFEEVRLYTPGDDPRSIDWRVTARRGRPHTKLFHEERERPVWLLVDLQPGTFFGSRRQLKSALIVRVAALLAWTAALEGDRVGALVATGQAPLRILPARARLAGVLALLETLLAAQPRAPAPPEPQALLEALRASVPLIRPGSQILALSDFAAPAAREEPLWLPLTRHNDIRLYWATDPLEAQGLPAGRFRAGLPGRLAILDGQRVRTAWHDAWRAREQGLARLSQRLAAPVVRLDTSQPAETALRQSLLGAPSAA